MPETRKITLEKQPDGKNIAVVTTESESRTEVQKREVNAEVCYRMLAELSAKRRTHVDEVAALDEEIGVWRSIEEQLRQQ